MTVLEIVKRTDRVEFTWCDGQSLWYDCMEGSDSIFRFPIPLADTVGGIFQARDHKPLHFMRWIRKEVERVDAEAVEVDRARKNWNP